jgi:methionine aminopeptidase
LRTTDYTLGNPDTLTKYKVAAEISQKVLKEVSGALPEPGAAAGMGGDDDDDDET